MVAPRITIAITHERLPELLRRAPAKVTQAIYATAVDIERDAKIGCPVDTGRLRASIHAKLVGPRAAEIGTNVEYGAHVEMGHHTASGSYVAGRPYLTPAVERHAATFRGRLMRLMEGLL